MLTMDAVANCANTFAIMAIREEIQDWLQRNLDKRGHGSRTALARHLGIRPDAVTRMLNPPGKEGREISAQELMLMEQFFGEAAPPIDTVEPIEEIDTTVVPLYGGRVQAGAFLEVDVYFQQDEFHVPEFVTRHPGYRRLRQYAYEVVGDSMNAVGIEDGMWIVAADAGDYVDFVGEVESGRFVVVERSRYQGAERELTVKELQYYRDRYELVPRSTNPSYKPIIVPNAGAAEDGSGLEVRIVGVVLTSFRDYLRPRSR